MSMKSVVAAVFAGALMLSSAGAMAAGGHGGGGGGHGGGGWHGGGGGWHGGGWHGGGWGRSSVFIGSGFGGFWPYGGYGYGYGYPDYYAYPPPVVYAPPPPVSYYAPPVAASVPAPAQPYAANQGAGQGVDQSYCRQYQGTVMVDGATQPSSGVACRQPNGTWRIVQ
jgi:hypothetical protein